uniref:von Willebrand factor A domain containing 5B2 n=1 Tax=Sander lucioperca TaxID=283035 RepID=A0A8D0CQJ0_SANLU
MVGLRNCSTWEPLLLKASCIKSCANGCSLGITAHLTYANADIESVEGVFVYPLGEKEVVVGFEAVIAGRLMGVQIQSRGNPLCLFELLYDVSNCCISALGHLILDEDLERSTFIVGTGVIGPMDIVSVIISTTLELPTLENGAIRIVYPTLLTPIVTGQMTPNRALDSEQQCAHAIFTNPAANLAPYELNFQLLVRGACLLAGLESPTHALRADADPSAQSASATYITLAQEHPYDRHIEIILHLSEPHSPLVILERGRLSFSQYEQQICSRRDFIRYTRKDSEPERKVGSYSLCFALFICLLNLTCVPIHVPWTVLLRKTMLMFHLDAMVVALKSLPSGTVLNIVGFGTTIKPLFTSSKLCTDVSTNLLGALSWMYQQPMQRSYPRQVFIITDGSISNVAKVLELVRRNTCAGRCFGLGLGPRACRRLLQGVAKLTGGTTEFLDDEERLQPKLIKSLKKAFEPVLTDVRIDWYLPENMEAFLSPNEIPPLYPGNRLIGYCTLYDMTNLKAKKTEVYITTFFKSTSVWRFPEKSPLSSPVPETQISEPAQVSHSSMCLVVNRYINQDRTPHTVVVNVGILSTLDVELDWSSDVMRRIQERSYIQEQYVLTRCSLSSEWSLQTQSHSHVHTSSNSDSAGLEKMATPEQRSSLSRWADSAWQRNLSVEAPDNRAEKVRLIVSDSPKSNGLLFPASPLDWDSFTDPEYLFTAVAPEDPPPGQCRSLIHGLLSGRPVSWEVTVDLGHLWTPDGQETPGGPWEEIIHQLTARSVIRDFEKMAEKESSAKRYRMKAIQTSKHFPSQVVADRGRILLVWADGAPAETVKRSRRPGTLQVDRMIPAPISVVKTLGHQQSLYLSDRDDTPASPCSLTSWDSRQKHIVPALIICVYLVSNQVRLQLASGAFLLTEIYSDCVQIPLDRLKRASPYSLHRRSLSPPFRCTYPSAPSLSTSTKPPGATSSHHLSVGPSQSQIPGQADSGRGSETDVCEGSSIEPADLQGSSQLAQEDLEGTSWATAVALAWLEHRCAGYFMEWELMAAKADFWLRGQELPEGVDLAGLKGAARQLFLLLRHWDENIKLNMLCYNPNNM